MEEKKFDINTLIGFVLIGGILLWMLYLNPSQKKAAPEATKTEQTEGEPNKNETPLEAETKTPVGSDKVQKDSLGRTSNQKRSGTFSYATTLPSAQDKTTVLENDLLLLKISNKGGQIVEAKMKKHKTSDSIPVYLIKNGKNASFDLSFKTKNGKTINTETRYFAPALSNDGKRLSMKLKVSEDQYLEYIYSLRPGEYMLDFTIRSQGLKNKVNTTQPATLTWKLKTRSHAESISYENRYTEIVYAFEDGEDSYTGQGDLEEEEEVAIDYVAFKQHLFSSILLAEASFDKGKFISKNLVQDEEVDTTHMKAFTATLPISPNAGEFSKSMQWYYGPTDYTILTNYDRNLDEIVSLGWGIFGWINQYLIIPFFGFLVKFLPAGIAIICLTIAIKILLSPVQYKQYLSQAKMKILKPEIAEIKKKHKGNTMKTQQETMALYSKAGASPMAGCLPALLQIPVFYALFMFFPSVFNLRNKSFLWADDLSSFDVVAELPFPIPWYGDHVSLFPILASVAIFFSMKLTTGNNMASSQPTQEGMPDMGKMMKYMMYLSPIFMLFFFNNYPSGLSLYYFTSNVITIGIIIVIKRYIIDEDKVLAKIELNKKKPRKKGKFSQKLQEMMEQAEEQKKARQRQKR